jgi:uncharacterized protein (TIGR02147 family)
VLINVYRYDSLAACLNDMVLHHCKKENLSLRDLGKQLQWSLGLLPLVLRGQRRLSQEKLEQLLSILPALKREDRRHLLKLHKLEKAKGFDERRKVFKSALRSKRLKSEAPSNARMFAYLENVLNPILREAVALDDFEADEDWIQNSLVRKATPADIRASLEFLKSNFFIERDRDGRWRYLDSSGIKADDMVLKMAMGRFHKDMLKAGAESIDEAAGSERYIRGITAAISNESYAEIAGVLADAMNKIQEIQKRPQKRERVYHVNSLAFPLTKTTKKKP